MIKEPKIFCNKCCKLMGSRIQKARKWKNIKQRDVASLLGISSDHMSNIENGRVICKTEYLYILEQVLDVSVIYLFHGNDYANEVMDTEINSLMSQLTPDQKRRSIAMIKNAFL